MTLVSTTPFSELSVGQTSELIHTISEKDILLFAAASGDNNPVHLDEAYAQNSCFGRRIMHGMYTGALISRLLGTQFPGPGTIYLSQTLNSLKPVFVGDVLTIRLEVVNLHASKPVATLACEVRNSTGATVTVGESIVMVPTEAKTTRLPDLPVVSLET